MTNAQRIKMALAYVNKSEAQIARGIDTTPQAFNQRMKTDKFSAKDMESIAKEIGAEYKAVFVFPDGTQIG